MQPHYQTLVAGRIAAWLLFGFLPLCWLAGACKQKLDDTTLQYRIFLGISDVKSYYYSDPQLQRKYPIVKGFLTNKGSEKLEVVELTINFQDNLGNTIFVDHGFPVFISSYSSTPVGQQYLFPGQRIPFAFKSVSCPPSWQQGRVELEITKVVISRK